MPLEVYHSSCALQKAHVQQFVATEDALNKAAEAKALCQKLLKRLQGSNDALQMLPTGGTTSSMGSTRKFEVYCLLIHLFVTILMNKLGNICHWCLI